jgi:uncharacterized damage-inducible protein DinB
MTDRKQFLIESLDGERAHILSAVEGLSDEQMREVKLPSGWTCMTMLKHLALGVEHYWFSCIFGGESLDFFDTDEMRNNGEWQHDPRDTGERLRALYRAEAATSNNVAGRLELNASPLLQDPMWGEWSPGDFFEILMHVIEETATHAGHLDAVRELIDGHQHFVL